MNLLTFKTLWGHPDSGGVGSLRQAFRIAVADGFDGVEGQIPADGKIREEFTAALEAENLCFIAEVCTAGSYVPDRTADLDTHLADLDAQLGRLGSLEPVLVNCIGGCDRWDLDTSCAFFSRALETGEKYGVTLSFETHRGRSLYSPWVTERVLDRMALPLTCDFSHWCVVCEGLGESEDDLIRRAAGHARHIHGRVGYDQGPQVPDPEHPRYRDDLDKHLRWWRWIWDAQRQRGATVSTLTPEFGPDGYQMIDPHTDRPVGELTAYNRWMANRCRTAFLTKTGPDEEITARGGNP